VSSGAEKGKEEEQENEWLCDAYIGRKQQAMTSG
jgi:hypothetical protein